MLNRITLLFCGFLLVFGSCDLTKDKKVSSSVFNQILGEDVIHIQSEAFYWAMALKDYRFNYVETGSEENRFLSDCAFITLDSISGSFPTKKPGAVEWYSYYDINFSYDGDCPRDVDGVVREGNSSFYFLKNGRRNDTVGLINWDNLLVEPYTMNGQMAFEYAAPFIGEGFDYPQFKLKGENLEFVSGNQTIYANIDFTIRQAGGNLTEGYPDDGYFIMGNGSGIDRNGEPFTFTISSSLVWTANGNCVKGFKHGRTTVTNENSLFFIDYDVEDTYACDNRAFLIVGENDTREVSIRR